MVRLYVRHPVQDYATWRQAYDDFDSERSQWKVQGDAVYQSVDDPNDVTVWHDFPDRKSAEEFVNAPRLREVMGEAGVAGEPDVWVVEKA